MDGIDNMETEVDFVIASSLIKYNSNLYTDCLKSLDKYKSKSYLDFINNKGLIVEHIDTNVLDVIYALLGNDMLEHARLIGKNDTIIKGFFILAIFHTYDILIPLTDIKLTETKRNFKGDYTYMAIPLAKTLNIPPNDVAESLGTFIVNIFHNDISDYNTSNGFLNITLSDSYWIGTFNELYNNTKTI